MKYTREDAIEFIHACVAAAPGIETPSRLASEAGLSPSTVNKVLNRKREIKHLPSGRTLAKLASVAGLPPPTATIRRSVPLFGIVGAGERVEIFPQDQPPEMIDAPPGMQNGAAVKVRGNSMYPAYLNADLLFFSQIEARPITDALRHDCIILAKDGNLYCKRLEKGNRDYYRLISYASPEILNLKIEWAAPIEWVRRA